MSNDRVTPEELAFRGLANWHQPTDREIQAGIDQTLRDVVRHDARHNVHDRPGMLPPTDAKPRGSGGSGTEPLGLPAGVAMIDDLVNRMLPHGPKSGAK